MDTALNHATNLTPGWLRPAAVATFAALHGAILWGLPAREPPVSGIAPAVEVSIIPEGDPAREIAQSGAPGTVVQAVPDATAETESAAPLVQSQVASPVEPPAAAAATPPPAEPPSSSPDAAPPEAPPAKPPSEAAIAQDPPVEQPLIAVPLPGPSPSPAMPIPVPTPVVPPPQSPLPIERPRRVEPPRPTPQELRAAERRREIERERARESAVETARERERQRRAAQARQQASMREAERRAAERGRHAATSSAGASSPERSVSAPAQGSPQGGGARQSVGNASSGAYAAQVRAILQARANALGLEDVEGAVGISFSVGPSGRLMSHGISRPSGNFVIDRAIRSMLASVSFPPPPGGSFSSNVTVRIR